MKHLIFYDDQCPFCQTCVNYVQKIDKEGVFEYDSLTSPRAKKLLEGKDAPHNTLILLEGYKKGTPRLWIRSKGAFRILWLIGKWRKIIGVLCFLPGVVIDPFYRLVAHFRSCK